MRSCDFRGFWTLVLPLLLLAPGLASLVIGKRGQHEILGRKRTAVAVSVRVGPHVILRTATGVAGVVAAGVIVEIICGDDFVGRLLAERNGPSKAVTWIDTCLDDKVLLSGLVHH